jgi:two-component system NtrC family sensor kinase
MCVPIHGPDGLIGLLQVDSVGSPVVFTEDDLRTITMLGLQAGAAIANARLYENLDREKTALAEANRRLAEAQKQLIQNEKMVAVGELAAGVVHDIKTPLTIMRGYAHLLREQCERVIPPGADARQAQENLKAIDDSVTYCAGIIDQLLQFARQAEPVKMPVRVGELVQGVLKLLQAEFTKYGIGVEEHIGTSDPSILADPGQLQQVFMNILINAIQAMPKRGRVRVGVREEKTADRHGIVVSIEDTGVGMTEDEQRRIFDPFYTNKKADSLGGGVGLGLAVSHGIVQNHGGTITLRSEKGIGTTFYVKLPVGDPSMPPRVPTRLMGA